MSRPTHDPASPNQLHSPDEAAPTDVEFVARALIESEERYRSIVTAMSEGIVMQDAQGRIIECNASAERILGMSREQMMGLTSLDPRWQATSEDGHPIRGEDHPIRVTLRTGNPQRDAVMGVRRADGSRVWVCVNTQPLFHPGEEHPYSVVASFADITDMKLSEAALRESEDRFRSLYEHSMDGVLLTAPDGGILAVNPEGCRLLGRSEAEICAVGRAGVVDTTDPRLGGFLEERAATGRARGELTLVRGDGTRFPADVSSAIFMDRDGNRRTSLTFRDVSDRKRAEDAMREANLMLEQRVAERTRTIGALMELCRDVASQLDLVPLLTQILDRLREVIEFTGAAIAIVEDEEIAFLDYTGPARRDEVVRARISLAFDSGYRRVIESREPLVVGDILSGQGAASEAGPAWVEPLAPAITYVRSWLGVPLIARGELIGVLRLDHEKPDYFTGDDTQRALAFASQVAVGIDNARLHSAAQQAAALAERARLSRELHDSVSQALYGIALGVHSARAMLGPSQDTLQRPLDLILGLTNTALTELRALIFELRPDALEKQGLVTALERHADMLRARHGLRTDTHFGLEPDLPMAKKEALYRIAQEASSNVAKHAGATRAWISLVCEDGTLALEVRDDGKGFDPAQTYPGHLGLRSMRERAELMGATLEIESADTGTRVRVRMPYPAA